MTQQTRAYLYAALAVFFWSTVASAFKISLRVLTPAQLLLVASLASTLILFITLIIRGEITDLRRSTKRDLLNSAVMGLINPCVYYLILFKAYSLLPGQEAQPLNFTWGIILPLLSVPLLGQRIRPVSFLAILLSFAGVYVIAVRGDLLSFSFANPLGTGLALGSSLLWALYWILGMRDGRKETVKLFLNFVWGTLFVLIWTFARGELDITARAGWLGGAYVGIFEMGLTFVIWLTALRLSRTTAQVANLIFLAPFVSLVLLHLIAGEEIRLSSLGGLVLIVAGIILQKRLAGELEDTVAEQ
ncbi:MAG: DMT family transporter [bacterium]|nr:DMT family transporter [bacterium]